MRWVLAIVLSLLLLVTGAIMSGPSPPTRIVIATGQPVGMYHEFGGQYQKRLGRLGLQVDLRPTNGSIDNLQRLLRREVDVAFVQGGTAALVAGADARLRGIAALYLEPLWIFHRREIRVDSIAALAGRRIAVGPVDSGTEAVATALLREHDISDTPGVVRLDNVEARDQLARGAIDVAFFVASYRDPTVTDLIRRRDLALLGFRRDAAYTRKFPALKPVVLPEGLLDLRHNVPEQDTVLLAPAALLVGQDDLHPRVVEQILKVAQAIHGPGSLIDTPLRFPSLEGVDLPIHHAADVYLRQGESRLSRTLPYPLLRWALLLRLLVLPVLLVWFPLFRVLPEVAGWRVNRRLAHLYTALLEVERAIIAADRPDVLRERVNGLDRLLAEMEPRSRKIPAGRQRDVYQWRLHVAMVRTEAEMRLAHLLAATPDRVRSAVSAPGRRAP